MASSNFRLTMGIAIALLGFFSPFLAFPLSQLPINNALKSLLIGGLVFGIPEVLMLIAVAIMGKDGWDLIKKKLHAIFSIISPQKVGKFRYYFGVVLFSLCLFEGVVEIHSSIIQNALGKYLFTYQLLMNVLFVLSFFIAGGDFWDKIRSIFRYDQD